MARKREETPEERRERAYKRMVQELENIPEPSYTLKVGDSAFIGNLQDVVIVGVYDGGRIYEIDYTDVAHNYGNPIRTPHSRMFWYWYQVRPVVPIVDHKLIQNEDLRLHYSQTSLLTLFGFYYGSGLDLDPYYQRGYVWEDADREALLDSLYRNIDIGKFVVVHRKYKAGKPSYEVLDGKQRIRTLLDFYENRIYYKGLRFNDLSHEEKWHFTGYAISYAELNNVTEEQKLRYFVAINTFGKVMPEEQIKLVKRMIKGEN